MTQRLFIISLIVVALMLATRANQRPIEHPPGVLVNAVPAQVALDPAHRFRMEDFDVTARAEFDLTARILSSRRYRWGRAAKLSPLDLALGWGVMSDQAVLDRIDIKQSNRWYFTRYENPAPVTDSQIINHSGNMHMVPADASVAKRLKKLRPGEVVRLRGYLVDVDHDSGWFWRTSMSRNDSGDGACEIVYVEQLDRLPVSTSSERGW